MTFLLEKKVLKHLSGFTEIVLPAAPLLDLFPPLANYNANEVKKVTQMNPTKDPLCYNTYRIFGSTEL